MLKRTRLAQSLLIAFGGSTAICAVSVMAQEAPAAQPQQLERVEVTGSAIKRIDAETSVPVTVVRMSDLKKQGVTTVEQVMASLTAVQTQGGTSYAVGNNNGGGTFADIRGIGEDKTLVLLNGRRIANNAINGAAPDLNTIPFGAIDRIEVLRDGASALYGTDAIGGVINFITKREVQGGSITLGADKPQHPGGRSKNAGASFGFGDLDTQNFNLFGFIDYQHQNNISGAQRPYNSRISGGISGSTSPGNYFQGNSAVGNPSAPSCASGTYLIPSGDGTSCYMTTSKFVDYVPQSERYSAMLKGTFKLSENTQAGLDYFYTKTDVRTLIAPVPYGALKQNPYMADGVTPNPYYPGNSGNSFAPAFTPDLNYTDSKVGAVVGGGTGIVQKGYVNVKWRDLPNGPRGDKNINEQQRLQATLDGNLAGWDYSAAFGYNSNIVDEYLISGYNNGQVISDGVLNGVINPYGAQSAAGQALIDSALLAGLLTTSKGQVITTDAHASKEIGDWLGAGRQAAIAIGAEHRREMFSHRANTDYATLVVASTGVDPTTDNHGSRNVDAGYFELNVPIVKSLDITAAARYDKYSDSGSTFNPKVSVRYQPFQAVLLRSSYSTGFRAPSLYELHSSPAYGTGGTYNNPVTCPGGTPTAGFTAVNNCKSQFEELTGGNTMLKPEKSKNFSFGLVLEPLENTSFGVDFWWIQIRQSIGQVSEDTVFGDYSTFKQYFHTLSNGALSTDGTECPGTSCGYVDLRTQNLGGKNTNGLDFSASYRLPTSMAGTFNFGLNSTWVHKYEYQDYENGPWNQNVGVFSGTGPIFRWQHALTAAWSMGQFGAGVAAHYKSGYLDQDLTNHVPSYTTIDVNGSWSPVKSLTLTAGVKNIADRDPPYTMQTQNFTGGGWDSRYADPTGRTYYARGTFTF